MDAFRIITVGGKYKLEFDGHTYGYSNPIGNIGCRWSCILKTCSAHVNTNKSKNKITGGDYMHTHDKDLSKQTKEKSSPLTLNKTPVMSGKGNSSTTPKQAELGQTSYTTPTLETPAIINPKSLLVERNAAIDTIVTKQREKEELEAELAECKLLISNLQDSLKTMEAAWTIDKAELAKLQKQIAPLVLSSSRDVKLTLIGDSHVHNLEPLLHTVFPSTYNIKCYPKSGAGVEDICNLSVREHSAQDIVMLFVGTNDVCKTSWLGIKTSFKKLIDKFKSSRLIVILIPPRRNTTEFNYHIQSLNVKISNFLNEEGVSFINPAIILKNKHYGRDNLHLNKVGKDALCNMIKSYIVDGKLYNILTKSRNCKIGSDRVTTQTTHGKSTSAKTSTSSKTGIKKSTNILNVNSTYRHKHASMGVSDRQLQGSKHSRYPGNRKRFSGDNKQNRGVRQWDKNRGNGKRAGGNHDARFKSRVVYNNVYRGGRNYIPPPAHYNYDYFPPQPYLNNYDYDYYDYNCDPYYNYSYQDQDTHNLTRNVRNAPHGMNFF